MTHECDMYGDNNTALRIEHECPYTGEISLICFLCYIPRSTGGMILTDSRLPVARWTVPRGMN